MAFDNGKYIPLETDPGKCQLCGKIKELRPYGPNKEWLCFKCGMKDEEHCKKRFREMLKASEKKTLNAD